jgi:Zn-finger nucleic acid-binding protein
MSEEIRITCPRCNEILDRLSVASVEIDLCPGCSGIWLDKGELALLRERAGFRDLRELKQHCAGQRVVPPSSRNVQLACPSCAGTLSAVGMGRVLVDACDQCEGIWLDRGELEEAMTIIAPDGDEDIVSAILAATNE